MEKRLEKVIKEMPGTVEEKCKRLGVSNVTLYKYLKSKTKPTTQFLTALKMHTRINLDWLITGEGEPYIGVNPKSLDTDVLATIIDKIEQHLESQSKKLSAIEKSNLISNIYVFIMKEKDRCIQNGIQLNDSDLNERIQTLMEFKLSS